MAALILISTGATVPAFAQLPPTNMGKFIHQPGDNQYTVNTQLERHGTTYLDRTGPGGPVNVSRPGGGSGSGAFGIAPMNRPTSINPMVLLGTNTPKIDISLEPISADEPIEPPGFPPLPDRLQLPVQMAGGSWAGKTASAAGGGQNGGGSSGGGGNGTAFTGVKQHYAHFKPGGFQGGGPGGGGGGQSGGGGGEPVGVDPDAPLSSSIGGANPNRQPVNPGGSLGYYRCLPADPVKINRAGDTFNSNPNGAGAASAPRYNGASSRDLAKLGPAPKLDDMQEQNGAPEAPHAAIVNQAVSQDLSLPDDEFVSRYGLQDSGGKRFAKSVGRGVVRGAGRAARRATGQLGF